MIRWKLVGPVLISVAMTALIAATPLPRRAPDSATQAAEIDRLIRRLGSDDFDEREEAARALKVIGQPALDAVLNATTRADDPEIRRQARKLVDVLAPRYPELCSLHGHAGGVNGIAVSPDGTRALSASHDHTIRVWDLKAGKELRRLKDELDSIVAAVAFSPDGKQALSGGADQVLHLWDTTTWTELRRFKGHHHCIFRVAFSPNGRFGLSACSEATVRVWNLATGEQIHCFTEQWGNVYAATFSADGTKVLWSGRDGMRAWDLVSGEDLGRYQAEKGAPVAFSPAGDRALTTYWRTFTLLDLQTGAVLRTFQIKGQGKSADRIYSIFAVAFSPDGKRALSASADSTLRVWDVNTGEQLCCIDIPRGSSQQIAFSPDGTRALTADSDGTVRVWHLPR
jgi:WD40 repeat protein